MKRERKEEKKKLLAQCGAGWITGVQVIGVRHRTTEIGMPQMACHVYA
jgi:hypothetical protein